MIFATLLLFVAVHPGTSLPHSGKMRAHVSHQSTLSAAKTRPIKVYRSHHHHVKFRVKKIAHKFVGTVLAIFRGSKQRMVEQARLITLEQHRPIEGEGDIQERVANKDLTALETTSTYMVGGVDPRFRYCTPAAFKFLHTFAAEHNERFGKPLNVSSAIRTPQYQKQLSKNNKNAAASFGPKASSHLYGVSLDFTTVKMSAAEIAWIQNYLKPLAKKGQIFVIQEGIAQHCFHITVLDTYLALKKSRVIHLTTKASVNRSRL